MLLVLAAIANVSIAQTWRNETDVPAEADYAVLYLPSSFIVTNGLDLSPTIYGRIFEAGVTPAGGGDVSILAELGWGADGSDPRVTAWTWSTASFTTQVGNDDEYAATFTTPATAGTYDYTFRFSVDSGASWTLADLDGTGSNAGLTLSTANFGSFTVQNTAIPEPGTYALIAGGVGLALAAWRRQRRRAI